jgi:hypothetical protein
MLKIHIPGPKRVLWALELTTPILSTGNSDQNLTDQSLTNGVALHITRYGTTVAKEIVVQTSTFPDYVFKPTYKLTPLSEVKNYIDENQHLPEIPSEAEVKKDGINLGEMNKLLVKKVEELTLYLIEKDKQVNDQQKRMDQLQSQLEALTKEIHKN